MHQRTSIDIKRTEDGIQLIVVCTKAERTNRFPEFFARYRATTILIPFDKKVNDAGGGASQCIFQTPDDVCICETRPRESHVNSQWERTKREYVST